MKREVTPNRNAIKTLRGLAKLTQSQVISKGLTLSYRQYQRAEGGKEKVSFKDVENIAKFYDKYLKENTDHKINVYVDDIIVEDRKDKTEKETKNFSYNIYLHRIESYEQLSDIINQSKFQKIFYPNNPDKDQAAIIKEIVREFKKVYDDYNRGLKNEKSDNYENIEKELESLDENSNFSAAMKMLNEKKLYLYANNFIHSVLGYEYHEEAMVFFPKVYSKNYAIFCFKDFKTTSLTFKYETDFPKDRIEKLIKDKPWSMDPADFNSDPSNDNGLYENDDSEDVKINFEKNYKEYFVNNNYNFDKSKVSLIKTDIEDLVDEDDLLEYTNKQIESEVEEGNLMYAPDISDYIDPKDD